MDIDIEDIKERYAYASEMQIYYNEIGDHSYSLFYGGQLSILGLFLSNEDERDASRIDKG